jgi:hypothetical protein
MEGFPEVLPGEFARLSEFGEGHLFAQRRRPGRRVGALLIRHPFA